VLKHHDRLQVEAVCYSGVRRPDAVTQKLRSAAHLWRDTRGMSDQAMTRQIVDDRIDILVDLTLHMADNRLTVFARKPAPIQLTWLAYPGTSGMSAMDYRITDPYLDPVEIIQPDDDPLAAEMRGGRSAEPRYRPLAPQPYSEESVWLPHSFWCYQPIVPAPQANALPAIGNGFITFGCFNNFAKVSEPAIRLWARVLHAVPGSRLLLQSRPGLHLIGVRKIFADAGIGRDRVEFVDRKPADEFFRLHHRIDIALDPIPYPGHTTAMDGLWMGVPVVTLAGSTVASRGGVSLLNNVGLAELIAFSQDEYVRIAARLAGDLPRLTMLRASLRVRMEQSPLTDGKQFARDLETIYRRLWRGYCDGTMQRRRLAE
jgi:predicted O-linked N-acetylglucosamine transferase (SPINDLY family)